MDQEVHPPQDDVSVEVVECWEDDDVYLLEVAAFAEEVHEVFALFCHGVCAADDVA